MKKNISLPNLSILKTEETTPKGWDKIEGGSEGTSLETLPETPTTPETPISNRMDQLMIIQMEPTTRTSGTHPKIKKHPKWMIGPKFNGRERWMDLTKIYGWNLEKKQTILSRSEIQHRGYEPFIEREYNPETDTDFTLLSSL